MKYIINYDTDGKILGFTTGETGSNIEVSNSQWVEGQKHNKIIVDGGNISFESVDWRTPEEKAGQVKVEQENQTEALIRQEIREMAINSLQSKGKLTAEGKMVKEIQQ